jgi:hypothetical protein
MCAESIFIHNTENSFVFDVFHAWGTRGMHIGFWWESQKRLLGGHQADSNQWRATNTVSIKCSEILE